ncbi:hypothetical protein LIER_34074 [Lithospermum erythrorhizon]|uniref:Uncharacterized protein n=1 Tax=Lithospermum erythrorhizon TaxID=34254 RepID=A0AAV3RYG7_LITER
MVKMAAQGSKGLTPIAEVPSRSKSYAAMVATPAVDRGKPHKNNVQAKGRVIVAWNYSFCSMNVVSIDDQHVLVEVDLIFSSSFFISAVYGFNDYVQRRSLWRSLSSSVVQGKPWILARNFNVIRSSAGASDVSCPSNIAMADFNRRIEEIDVVELSHFGCNYTWSPNWRNRKCILRKLDYAFLQ